MDPVVLLTEYDPTRLTVLEAVVNRATEIDRKWRDALSNDIASEVAKRFKFK